MVDIQSVTAEIRREKKIEEDRKKPQGKNIMSASATQGGHKNSNMCCLYVVASGNATTALNTKI